MMRDPVMSGTAAMLRVLSVLNLIAGVGFMLVLLATWPAGALLTARLIAKYHDPAIAARALTGIRLLMATGIVAVVPARYLLSALSDIVATLRDGDPFLPDNAALVRTIALALLSLQLLDCALGATSFWLAARHIDVATWTPSIGGWLAVLVAFVLARVFARGAEMRADLAGTV